MIGLFAKIDRKRLRRKLAVAKARRAWISDGLEWAKGASLNQQTIDRVAEFSPEKRNQFWQANRDDIEKKERRIRELDEEIAIVEGDLEALERIT